ncbi:hypothetical protein EMPS_01406 [Entomortierella parvispora]|uniref:Uncharacterized protein n=1 Tax=Entomortierella parvispora TaxID=205924 RepID=A0A9P3H2U0_9FUNG|nr:hypothetical protein EMPS_01406 [Entomortierella parvispora]
MGSYSLPSTLGALSARSDPQTRSRQQLPGNTPHHDHTLHLHPSTTTESSNTSTTKENARALETLAERLNVLAAGSLFLLPSVLPYLASALASLNSPDEDQSEFSRTANEWRALVTPMLPCLGLLLPIVSAKAHTRWRASHGEHIQNFYSSPQNARRRWPCPFRVVCSRKFILPMSTTTAEAQERLKGHDGALGRGTKPDRCTKSKTHSNKKARTLLLSSLGLWMVLLGISSPLGLNNVVGFSVQPEGSLLPSSLPFALPRQDCDQSQEKEAFGLPTGTMDLTWEEIQALVQAADEDLIMDSPMEDEFEDISAPTHSLDSSPALNEQVSVKSLGDCSQSVDSPVQEKDQEPTERGKILEYVPLWTDLWTFALALSLGGALVGLGQVQRQVRDEILSIDQRLEEEEGEEALLVHKKAMSNDNRGSYWTCRLFAVMALVVHIYIVQMKDWGMPMGSFLRLGAIGLYFGYSWIPENLPKASPSDDNDSAEEPKVDLLSVAVAME